MSQYQYNRPTRNSDHLTHKSSPLRHTVSNASTSSSAYSTTSDPFPPSRTSTISSTASSSYQYSGVGHKRGISESASTGRSEGSMPTYGTGPEPIYKTIRQSLRTLPQPPNTSPPINHNKSHVAHARIQSLDAPPKYHYNDPFYTTTSLATQPTGPNAASLGRSDSVARRSRTYESNANSQGPLLSSPELQNLQKSSTSHLRTLSRFAQDDAAEDFSLNSPSPSVVGMRGRRQLKRTDSISKAASHGGHGRWGGSNWMDKQRQFLQAYEYLCHIGEAKEWIEDIIQESLPPIVQLEEALRDGVTLAELVQALQPDRRVKIFRNPKLQFRHSDNIAQFFDFLAVVELPELFRFELIDLYEKKNIPKVIYCIHALSWLLYRKGMVDFRIGNLVGQLEFEHHELEEMQKGLDKAGVAMPSFSGMGATFGAEFDPDPEPEPMETEIERVERELAENEMSIVDFQTQVRAALIRVNLGHKMAGLWDAEEMLIELQSIVRGDWARQVSSYRLGMQRFATSLQSATRGFLERSRQRSKKIWWKDKAQDVIVLQSLVRARKSRIETQHLTRLIRLEDTSVRYFQAALRGALCRKHIDEQYEQSQDAGGSICKIQAAARGMLGRRSVSSDRLRLHQGQSAIVQIQTAIRAARTRGGIIAEREALLEKPSLWPTFEAACRGMLLRRRLREDWSRVQQYRQSIEAIQANARAKTQRSSLRLLKAALLTQEPSVQSTQAVARSCLFQRRRAANLATLEAQTSGIVSLQSMVRGGSARKNLLQQCNAIAANAHEITLLQSLSRAMTIRLDVGALLAEFDEAEPNIQELQAVIRGSLIRAQFAEKQRFFKANMEKVVKLQSFVRAKIQGEAYKSLTSGENPPVGTVKGFVHLLNDSDFDFDEEVEFERLRKTVVQHVRQNETADQYIQQLDIKIALLVKNKITLDEVVKHQKHFGGAAGSLLNSAELSSKDPFDLKALNKNSRRKLEQYQELFFILQTQSHYLARLFRRIREQAIVEKESERVKHLMMGLFGYAQKRREEYYLIKLIARSIKEEIDHCASISDYLRGNFFWVKLFGAYIKSPRDRKFMRDSLGPVVKENVIDNPELDLESDPMQIYLSAIENEQLRTGQRSRRSPDIPREEAIRDEETKRTFIAHLQDLRDIADQVFAALEENLQRMPYGVRYIAQQMFEHLVQRFAPDDHSSIVQIVGQWIWKNYLQTALLEPEKYGVVDRGLGQDHRRNIAQIIKVVGQVAAGRLFGGENVFLQPLNSYVKESIEKLNDYWIQLISIPNAETYFDIDEFNDLYAKTKPTLYIKMADIFAIHHLVVAETASICPAQDDPLREAMRELGSAKNNEMELRNVSSGDICLTLNPKLHDVQDPDADIKTLFTETKRCILYIIRVQSGANLVEIMVKPITPEDEDRWHYLVRDELSSSSRKHTAYSDTHIDIAAMSYAELKSTALENILQLEQAKRISRSNHYQDLLNAIAIDIRTKHRRRVQRTRELEGVRLTLARLDDQASYLEGQLKTYNDYIEQAMITLQNKKGKKRFLLPFTKQWDHERELARTGRVPKFGSFKYSAAELANRGILLSWQGYSERQWERLDITISSNEVGVFSIEGSNGPIAMPGATAEVPLDDLLQAQFNNQVAMEFFAGGVLRMGVNLFLHLIMRKFYKDKDG